MESVDVFLVHGVAPLDKHITSRYLLEHLVVHSFGADEHAHQVYLLVLLDNILSLN